ncbi:unnamed protein product [Victoria cruziana]
MAGSGNSLPLQERVQRPNTVERLFLSILSVLIFSFLLYRLTALPDLPGGVASGAWLAAFSCECWFAFIWVLSLNYKWYSVENRTFPHRLLQRFRSPQQFPAIDVFVTTADPDMEPPIIAVNTVLSILAVDYPPSKIACYVSDDGCSPITFFSLTEASKFARLWVTFCKKYEVDCRAPFKYFSHSPAAHNPSSAFHQEWSEMKRAYEELAKKISEASEKSTPDKFSAQEYSEFAAVHRRNHPAIVKVMNEHSGTEDDQVPHLIYISREKRPSHRHHFKAGAMNVLTRVSGVMTNAPFMLNLDCDMFVNNPKVMHHALCLLLGFESDTRSGFVQFPQKFHGGLEDDPYGNQLKVLIEYLMRGWNAHQGPLYGGTGCFHRRKVIYGQRPRVLEEENGPYNCIGNEALAATFGGNRPFIESVVKSASGGNAVADASPRQNLSNSLEAAIAVSASDYEDDTLWGKQVGWLYGSTSEDILTGCRIHSSGWNSVACLPDPPAFLGAAPSNGPDSIVQQKRWATGLFEILISRQNPIRATVKEKLQLRQCMVYLSVLLWAPQSVPELCYAVLPPLCIFTNTTIFPKITDPGFRLPAAIFIIFNLYTLAEYLLCGLSAREWWNNQRMARIVNPTARLFGLLAVFLKVIGISETVFEITRKDNLEGAPAEAGKFIFDSSVIYVPVTTLLFVNMAALALGLAKVMMETEAAASVGELVCCAWMVVSFLPLVKGLYRHGQYGIPWPTICKSGMVTLFFVCICLRFSN